MTLKELIVSQNKALLAEFRKHKNRIPLSEFDEAQIAILNVVQALNGLVSDKRIIEAIGKAKTPNAVSLALRNRLALKT